ncbi:hypothetical protein IP92_02148 [Pseudoduganella flava]|uniref:Uncharacterized protein n=1 Tax=Pseudoduganella flava TaxID=871742 RepID=A0A562PWF2_9BURK|nr:hypothetical protein [Pseudoduganella flava]QGZ39833.1 hypothetical protein GO485_12745 [Pseudoduganella flava]TWI48755.1 hypothetical protein IP92_02148 [Pseudoduganella flava]
MRIPAVLVVSVIVVAFAWSYGPAWAVFGALAVATFAFLGIRQALRSRTAGTPAYGGASSDCGGGDGSD